MDKTVVRVPFRWAGNVLRFLSSGREWFAHVPYSARPRQGVFRPALEGSDQTVLVALFERADAAALEEVERGSPLWGRLFRIHLSVVRDLEGKIRQGTGSVLIRQTSQILSRLKGAGGKQSRVWAISLKAITNSPLDERSADPLVTSTYPLTPRSFFYPNAIQVVCGEREGLPAAVWEGIFPLPNTMVPDPKNHPVLLGYSHPHGLPVLIEFGGVQQAKHFAIFGPTGSGKSVTAQYLLHSLRQQGMRAIVVDVKEEMARRMPDGKVVGLFGMRVVNPASPSNPMLWNAPSSIELLDAAWEEGAVSRKDGKVVFNGKAWRRALDRVASGILADCQLAASLINHVILGRGEGINPNHLHGTYASRLADIHEDPSLRQALTAIAAGDPMGFAFHTSRILAEYVSSRLDGKAADTVIGERAPFRHLLVPNIPPQEDEAGDFIIQMGGFGVQVDRYGEEAARALYSYLINLVVGRIIRSQRATTKMGLEPIRFVLYLEEAHRLDPHVIEKAARLFRAFGCSLLVVTQSIQDFAVGGSPAASPILEQMSALIHMLANAQSIGLMLEAYGERIPYPEWVIPEARFGEGVLVTRVGGRPSAPVRFKTAIPNEVLEHIMSIRGLEKRSETDGV